MRIVRPAYQGLIQQLDDHLGRLFDYMEGAGLMRNTLVIFTSDHGDFLGDHWLGEKELFYDTVQRVPLIVMDPSPAGDAVRGTVSDKLVEGVDIVPTILQALEVPLPTHRIEGRALQPLLHGATQAPWRDCVFSELDYSFRQARLLRGKTPQQARAHLGAHRPLALCVLADLANDPGELQDLGRSPAHEAVRAEMRARLLEWSLGRKTRVTIADSAIERSTNAHKRAGIHFGQW
ncbi:sulfatase [Bordetella pertussis]|nr:sulfatase [Bordetella pertussis]